MKALGTAASASVMSGRYLPRKKDGTLKHPDWPEGWIFTIPQGLAICLLMLGGAALLVAFMPAIVNAVERMKKAKKSDWEKVLEATSPLYWASQQG